LKGASTDNTEADDDEKSHNDHDDLENSDGEKSSVGVAIVGILDITGTTASSASIGYIIKVIPNLNLSKDTRSGGAETREHGQIISFGLFRHNMLDSAKESIILSEILVERHNDQICGSIVINWSVL